MHPAGSRGAQGMGDCEFGFDEEDFFSAQADGEPTLEERRRGDSGPSQEVFGAKSTLPSVQEEEEACDAFLSKAWEHPEFKSAICSPVFTGPTALTRPMRYLSAAHRLGDAAWRRVKPYLLSVSARLSGQ
eukprot:3307113-Amphidinium_carterae.1